MALFKSNAAFNKPATRRPVGAIFLLGGVMFMSSFISHAHPHHPLHVSEPQVPPAAIDGDKSMLQDHRQVAKIRAQDLREKSKERAQQRRDQLDVQRAQRRRLLAEQRITRKAEIDQERKGHLDFKSELLSMLASDRVLPSGGEGSFGQSPEGLLLKQHLKITYLRGDILANGLNLSERFGARYPALWRSYGRSLSDASYIMIKPKSYEIREISEAGGSYHFMMQTG